MYRIVPVLAIVGTLLAAGATASERTVTLAVKNMYCAACPYIVGRSLKKVRGVAKVAISYENKTARVTFDDRQATVAVLTAATTQAGYPSRPIVDPVTSK
jgi:mercuric ion binding protein